jgi:hypothetical protein
MCGSLKDDAAQAVQDEGEANAAVDAIAKSNGRSFPFK